MAVSVEFIVFNNMMPYNLMQVDTNVMEEGSVSILLPEEDSNFSEMLVHMYQTA